MKKTVQIIDNQKGSAIIFALLILVITTILGISATRMSTVDSQIVRNQAIFKQNIYEAEAAAIETGEQLYNIRDKWVLSRHTMVWLNDSSQAVLVDPANWDGANSIPFDATFGNNLEVGVVDRGPSRSSDLGIGRGSTREHNYSIFGIKNRGNSGQVMVEIGFKKRF